MFFFRNLYLIFFGDKIRYFEAKSRSLTTLTAAVQREKLILINQLIERVCFELRAARLLLFFGCVSQMANMVQLYFLLGCTKVKVMNTKVKIMNSSLVLVHL